MPVPHNRPVPGEMPGRQAIDGRALRLLYIGFLAGASHERGKPVSARELSALTAIPEPTLSEIRNHGRVPPVADLLVLLGEMRVSPAEVLVPRQADPAEDQVTPAA